MADAPAAAAAAAPITVALVGAGDIFSHHATGMLKHPELYAVSCVCDPDAERVAAASALCGGCPTFPTLTEALEADAAASSNVSFEAVVLMNHRHHADWEIARDAAADLEEPHRAAARRAGAGVGGQVRGVGQ